MRAPSFDSLKGLWAMPKDEFFKSHFRIHKAIPWETNQFEDTFFIRPDIYHSVCDYAYMGLVDNVVTSEGPHGVLFTVKGALEEMNFFAHQEPKRQEYLNNPPNMMQLRLDEVVLFLPRMDVKEGTFRGLSATFRAQYHEAALLREDPLDSRAHLLGAETLSYFHRLKAMRDGL
ncbi:MAG: hypothetical protein KJ709_04925 [Nanoarchaeota archaeon]|nr:hypothetical protein [Nanoarchaeota archaeon]